MLHKSCYYCGSSKNKFYAQENGFSLVKCSSCGLLFVPDRPGDHEISEAHKQGIHSGLQTFNITGSFAQSKVRRYVNVLGDLYPDPKILVNNAHWLDVGCGHGEFMTAVQHYWPMMINIKGTEPNINKQKSAKKRGLDVSYFEIDSHEDRYDVISLLNVYSHLPDPPHFLSTLKALLNPQGELIIQTGDVADIPPDEQYKPLFLPDHLSFASEKIVVGILDKLNFDIISIRKYSPIQFSVKAILRESVKKLSPYHKSRLKSYFRKSTYAPTDMFIRARLKPDCCR
jgi:2-polyprenyl-3-methyl-5-hydroxy-6-metoxy-1,4-benzoquinol methylase